MTNESINLAIQRLFSLLHVIIGFITIILGVITKTILGLLCAIPLVGIVIVLGLSLVWTLCFFVLIMFSFASKVKFVGWVFSLIGLPMAIASKAFLDLTPSFGVLSDPKDLNARTYWAKCVIVESYPFSIEFTNFWNERNRSNSAYAIRDQLLQSEPLNRFADFDSDDWMWRL